MNAVPKFQQGGGFDSLFTEYKPISIPSEPRESRRSGESRNSSKEDEKGKLSEKDFFSMLKDIDGLPNEMKGLVNNLINTFKFEDLTGSGINDLATMYLSSLYQLKVIQQNKTRYDDALKTASENGALHEPAIAPNGQLVAQMEDGKITTVDLSTYFNNPDKYSPLTVSNVAYMRRYDPSFNNNQTAFDVIQNSMSFESFQKLIDSSKARLGTTSYSNTGNFSIEGKAIQGLKLLQNLSEEDRRQILESVTSEGLYEYTIVDKNQKQQITALVQYLAAALPDRAKTWAALKLGTPNKEDATQRLITQYLLGGQNIEHSIDIDYRGSMSKVQGKTEGSKDTSDKSGFWTQVASGQGGNDTTLTFIKKNGVMTLEGKYYGQTPGPEENCSLGDYLTKSGLGHMRTGPQTISFGDIKLSQDSFDDILVNTRSGAYAVTLPVKEGKVWLELVDIYSDFKKELRESRIDPKSEQYAAKVRQLLNQPEYSQLRPLIQSNGELTPNNSRHFLVLEGIASGKANGLLPDEKSQQSIGDFSSEYIVDKSDDSNLYQVLKQGLSNKEKGEYQLDEFNMFNPFDWGGNYDKIYKGNIYIPLTTNAINAINADDNKITMQDARSYEAMQQTWNKESTRGRTDSGQLTQ